MSKSGKRVRRPTELRLDEMAKASDRIIEDGEAPTPCPKCDGCLLGSSLEVEGGSCRVLRCETCGYVYMKRS